MRVGIILSDYFFMNLRYDWGMDELVDGAADFVSVRWTGISVAVHGRSASN